MAASETRVAEADLSFERLYRTHRRDVYNFVLHEVRNPDDAEEVTQVAFLNAYRALRNGHPPEKPRAWLLTIAQNVARRRFRKGANIHEVPLDTELAVAAPGDYDGPSAEEICAAFRELPENQRAALAMREIQGRSYAEIAAALSISMPAVETLIFRARRSLRALLEPEESRLRGVLLLPLALPGLIGKALMSGAASVGRAGLAGRIAGVVGAIAVGAGVVEFVPPLIASEEPPAVVDEIAPRNQLAPVIAVEPKPRPAATHAGRNTPGKADSASADAAGPAGGASPPAALPELPEVSPPTLPSVSQPLEVPEVPTVEVPTVEVPTVEVPQVSVPPAPPPPDLPDLD